MSKFTEATIERIKNEYNAECDMFPFETQVNITDMRLLAIITQQQATIEALQERLHKLEIFTGMSAPDYEQEK